MRPCGIMGGRHLHSPLSGVVLSNCPESRLRNAKVVDRCTDSIFQSSRRWNSIFVALSPARQKLTC